MSFHRFAQRLAKSFQPDVVIAFSDTLYGIVGSRIAKQCGAAFVFDLYDHFESFGSASIPGVKRLYRQAIANADGVMCVSDRLQQLVRDRYNPRGKLLTVVNAVRKDLFFPRDRRTCREQLSLPADAKIIGFAGGLHECRGTQTLFEAFEKLAVKHPDLHLALAGQREPERVFPKHPRLHDFGMLPHDRVPLLLNALDLAIICAKPILQLQYAFLNKTYEILACDLPILSADVGPMLDLFAGQPACFYRHDDADDLARGVEAQLQNPLHVHLPLPSWDDLAADVDQFLNEVVPGNRLCVR